MNMWFNEIPNDIRLAISKYALKVNHYNQYKKVFLSEDTKRERRNLMVISLINIISCLSGLEINNNKINLFSNIQLNLTAFHLYILLLSINVYMAYGYFSSLWHEDIFSYNIFINSKNKLLTYIEKYVSLKADDNYFKELNKRLACIKNDDAKKALLFSEINSARIAILYAVEQGNFQKIKVLSSIRNYILKLKEYESHLITSVIDYDDKVADIKIRHKKITNPQETLEQKISIYKSSIEMKRQNLKHALDTEKENLQLHLEEMRSGKNANLHRNIFLNIIIPFIITFCAICLILFEIVCFHDKI